MSHSYQTVHERIHTNFAFNQCHINGSVCFLRRINVHTPGK